MTAEFTLTMGEIILCLLFVSFISLKILDLLLPHSFATDPEQVPEETVTQSEINKAVSTKRQSDIENLLQSDDDENKMDKLLLLAAKIPADSKEVVDMLLKFGADVNCEDSGITPLYTASKMGNEKVVHLLLDRGANAHHRTKEGNSLLHAAVHSNKQQIVKALFNAGVEVDAEDCLGNTPLHLSASLGHYEMVKLLIELGACLLRKNFMRRTALHIATEGGYLDIVQFLLEKGVYVDTVISETENNNIYGCQKTALHIATERNNTGIVEILLKAGANIGAKDRFGCTPLHCAARERSVMAASVLIKNGAEIDMCSAYAENLAALHIATLVQSWEVINVFFKAGANMNIRTESGKTPLHLAADDAYADFSVDNTPLVYHLLKFGCDINIVSSENLTALDYARTRRRNSNHNKAALLYLENHFRMMVATKIQLCQQLLTDEICSDLNRLSAPCKEELVRMKNATIGNSKCTLYSLLGKSEQQLVIALKNKSLRSAALYDRYEEEFPNFGYLIINKFRNAMKLYNLRAPLLDNIISESYAIFEDLPQECVELILDLVPTEDLKVLSLLVKT